PADARAGRERRAVVDRGIAERAVEINGPSRLACGLGVAARRELRDVRPLDDAETRDAEIDHLDLLLARVVVAEAFEVPGVEGLDQAGEERRIDRPTWRRDPHLHRLAGVAHI